MNKLQLVCFLIFIGYSMSITELTQSSYENLIKMADKQKQKIYWFVEIYDPNTTDHEAIAYHNEYLKFAENITGAKTALIKKSEAEQICKEYHIYQFPTVLFFEKNKTHARIYTGLHTETALMKFAIISTNQKGPMHRV